MHTTTYNFSLLSACFAHGAYQTQNFNRPELRAPSVKGMIRWWHKALGYSEADAGAIFGKVQGGNQASAVSFRIQPENTPLETNTSFMPHKGQRGGEKYAIPPGTRYSLTLTERRGGLSDTHRQQLEHATKSWLLLGSIGQRSNRAAGSILWDECPSNQSDFEKEVSELLNDKNIKFAVLDRQFNSETETRNTAGRFKKHAPNDRRNPSSVPGAVFGSAKPRKSSPLKIKTVKFENQHKLLAIWIPSTPQDTTHHLHAAIEEMTDIDAKSELAVLLKKALPQLTP